VRELWPPARPTGFDSFADTVQQIASWFVELIELPATPPTEPV
jgi:hypothetical protein